jgi:putative aldouronate transport system substrate-binding protein
MVPVARWNDGTEKYMRFTESWRSVKTGGWGISKKGVGDDQNKLFACLALIDYAYSEKGTILMSYGPDAFIKTNADGSYVTFNFNGTQMPVIADATYAELWDKASGNYTNYARQFLGSTLSFMKSQAFEYQCTHDVGKEGAGYISTAIGLGTIKHPELAITENPWYTSVPTVLPTTKAENDIVKGYTNLADMFGTAKGKVSILVDMIAGGYAGAGDAAIKDAASAASTVADAWGGAAYLMIKQGAWENLQDYYKTLTK